MTTPAHRLVCPWWLGYVLANPLRRLWQDPDAILRPHVTPSMTVVEVGPGMGFFTLPLARLVGDTGRVITLDVQDRMLSSLRRRAEKAGLSARIDVRLTPPEHLALEDLAGRADFALLFAVVHEVPSAASLFADLHRALKPGGRVLVAEPRGHVTEPKLLEQLAAAQGAGFTLVERPTVPGSRSLLLRK